MEQATLKAVSEVVAQLVEGRDTRTAVKYLSPTLVVRGAKRTKKPYGKGQNVEVVVTIGRPNYRHRDFIKDAKAAGESFPIKGIQITFFPEPKKGKKRK